MLAALACRGDCSAQETNALEQRVRHWEVAAIKEAGNSGRQDLIPALQGAADASVDPEEPVRIWAKASLAKLGVKKYLDETIAELTTTNSALFEAHKNGGCRGFLSEEKSTQCAKMETQETAFKKLAYIRDPSTVKIVVQFLYSTEHYQFSPDVPPWWASGAAVRALQQMVDNPPAGVEEKVWQQWWEQNKSNYP